MNKPIERNQPSILGMMTDPIREFRLIKKHPRFFFALLLLSLVTSYVYSKYGEMIGSDPKAIAELERFSGQTIPAEIHPRTPELFALSWGMIFFFMPALSCLINAAILWILVRAYKTAVSYRQMYSFSVHLFLLSVLSIVTDFLVNQFLGNHQRAPFTSLANLLGVTHTNPMFSLLSYINLFNIWSTILIAYGIREITDLDKEKSWVVAILFFIIGMFTLKFV